MSNNKTKEILDNLPDLAQKAKPSTQKLFKVLKKRKPKGLDSIVSEAHDDVFEQIDCLECANCCKSLGPRITFADMARLAKHLRMKQGQFINQYLRIDEDDDYVFKTMPCPFLMADNYCMVYESRPKACKEFPHTDRKRFYQVLDITEKNVEICPAVYEIVEKIKDKFISPKEK